MLKKFSLRSAFILSFAALSGGLLFYTSQSVQRAEDDLRVAQSAVVKEQEAIRVLSAEWAFLNNPARLEALAVEYLTLVPPGAGQIMLEGSFLPDIVLPSVAADGFQDVSFSAPSVESAPVSDIFVKPRKKPHRNTARKAPVTKKRFDALLDELGSGSVSGSGSGVAQ